MFVRTPEQGLLDTLERLGVGCIPFSPLAQGLLTDKYLRDIPPDSRAAKPTGFLRREEITPQVQRQIRQLHQMAVERGQSLAEMALAWILRDRRITSVLIGASRPEQIQQNLNALKNIRFDSEELTKIDRILSD
jgi:L-glyceraldehyde 3-phosphate reductase